MLIGVICVREMGKALIIFCCIARLQREIWDFHFQLVPADLGDAKFSQGTSPQLVFVQMYEEE